jgi:hypothetical protein
MSSTIIRFFVGFLIGYGAVKVLYFIGDYIL